LTLHVWPLIGKRVGCVRWWSARSPLKAYMNLEGAARVCALAPLPSLAVARCSGVINKLLRCGLACRGRYPRPFGWSRGE
jgi:hypothetical protein